MVRTYFGWLLVLVINVPIAFAVFFGVRLVTDGKRPMWQRALLIVSALLLLAALLTLPSLIFGDDR